MDEESDWFGLVNPVKIFLLFRKFSDFVMYIHFLSSFTVHLSFNFQREPRTRYGEGCPSTTVGYSQKGKRIRKRTHVCVYMCMCVFTHKIIKSVFICIYRCTTYTRRNKTLNETNNLLHKTHIDRHFKRLVENPKSFNLYTYFMLVFNMKYLNI